MLAFPRLPELGGRAIRILLADDHPLFAEALRTLIERNLPASTLTVVPDLPGARRAVAAAPGFDLAILDLYMPGTQGFAGIAEAVRAWPQTPVVVMSGSADPADGARAIASGARGFLPKSLAPAVMAAALNVVLSGGTYLPADYGPAGGAPPAPPNLTPRESQVLRLLCAGGSNKEIARALELQEITVKLHVRNIFRKLGVRNRVEAANAALKLGMSS